MDKRDSRMRIPGQLNMSTEMYKRIIRQSEDNDRTPGLEMMSLLKRAFQCQDGDCTHAHALSLTVAHDGEKESKPSLLTATQADARSRTAERKRA